MKKKRRILSTFLAASMITTCMAGMSVPASADGETSTYSITIPSTLDVSGAGYTQLTGGIKASGTISGKLTLSAESTNEWNLKDGTKAVPYKLTESNTSTDLKDSWEFAAADLTGTGKTENVYVYIAETDYNNAAAGTYTDTVTFTASVEDAAPVLTYIEVGKKYNNGLDNVKFYYIPGETYREAVQKHGQESGMNWNIYEGSNNTTIYWNRGDGNLYINNKDNFATGSSAYCGFTLDSVVDPNQTYTHNIVIWD